MAVVGKLTGYVAAVRDWAAKNGVKPAVPAPPPVDPRRAQLLRLGIRMPDECIAASARAGIPLALGAAILMQETGGGANVFGHDPTIFVGAGEVTREKYLAYRAQRGPTGRGGMQGVGPVQLTWYAFQDEADRLGGCWVPLINMTVGFQSLAANVRRYGLYAGVRAYNGSGPAAEQYAKTVLARMRLYEQGLT